MQMRTPCLCLSFFGERFNEHGPTMAFEIQQEIAGALSYLSELDLTDSEKAAVANVAVDPAPMLAVFEKRLRAFFSGEEDMAETTPSSFDAFALFKSVVGSRSRI